MRYVALACILAAVAMPASAELSVRFFEGAPKDRFEIEYSGNCSLSDVTVQIDLGASTAGLILDITGSGAGVSVYQPLELVAGRELLVQEPVAKDGDTVINLPISTLADGDRIVFTTDVDDTKGTGPTMVSGAEITGAQVLARVAGQEWTGAFDSRAAVTLSMDPCNA